MTRFRPFNPLMSFLALLGVASLQVGCGGGAGASPTHSSGPTTPAQLRIETPGPGLYQVTYDAIQSAGFAQEALPLNALQLSNQGQPVAYQAFSADGRTLQSGDSIQFYAQEMNTQYSGTNVYWLAVGSGSPVAMAKRDGTSVASASPVQVYFNTLHMEQNLIFNHSTPGAPAADYWFWAKLTAPVSQGFSFQLPGLDEAVGPSILNLGLLGDSAVDISPDHHVLVSLNGTQVASLTWTGVNDETRSITLPEGILLTGDNTLTLTMPGDTGASVDVIMLNYFEIQAWQPLRAQGGALAFATPPASGAQPVQVGGFLVPDILLLDVTDPLNPSFVTPVIEEEDTGTYHALFQDRPSGSASYLALSRDQLKVPSSMETWTPGGLLAATNGADYLVITPRAFFPAAQPLLQSRSGQGLRAKVVAVEDIFNQFGYGLPVPDTLKSFLAYASQNWVQPAPKYVLLLGDATFDYRNYMGTGKVSQVPCHLSITDQLGLTPDDNWYSALDGMDDLPSLNIGRLPAANPTQAEQVVQKVVQYENETIAAPTGALLVAGNEDTAFPNLCDTLAGLLPAKVRPTKVYMENFTDFSLCSQDIVTALNQGMVVSTYNGHGNVTEWSGEMIFNAGDLPLLTNGSMLTFSLMLNCENGWFAMPGYYCLAESLVGTPGCGAIGAFACSGLGFESDHALVARNFFQLFFASGNPRIGDVCTQAKVKAYQAGASMDTVRTFTLVGDPATRIRLPQ